MFASLRVLLMEPGGTPKTSPRWRKRKLMKEKAEVARRKRHATCSSHDCPDLGQGPPAPSEDIAENVAPSENTAENAEQDQDNADVCAGPHELKEFLRE